jgi:tetratricopeptide (TPR) repeat protein
MGTVYLAEQEEPIRRQVALKLIRAGMNTREVVRRFESERQSLALMSHPHIARVLDGGATDDGRPYFVMEYVPGAPLTAFCDQQRLEPRARLALFVQVCQAVQHAHQRGIIHRDLKPSNVLVSLQDGRPEPKVIDFGVARAIERNLGDTAFTQIGEIVGTPAYMSPEQAGSGLDVDTTTDVYSLGVILYELLVGTVPHDPDALRRAGPRGLPQMLRESEPGLPSTRLLTMGVTAQEVARRRSTDVTSLKRQIQGDLDWITFKAMEKERARRYQSAAELAADVERYLDDKPVAARPPSARYRMSKFAARHKAGVAAAAAVLLALLTGAVGAGLGFVRARRAEAAAQRAQGVAEREAAQAKAVADFLREVLGSADARQLGPDVKVRDALKKSLERLEGPHGLRPEMEAAVRDTVGTTLQNLAELEAAEKQITRGLEIRRATLGPEHPDTLSSMSNLFALYLTQDRQDQAVALGRETLALRRKVLGPDHADTTTTMNDLAVALMYAGKEDEAEALMREAAAVRRRVMGPDDSRSLVAASNLASLLRMRGKLAEAEPLLREVLSAQRRTLGPRHSNTLFTQQTLAGLLDKLGKWPAAEAGYREALEANRAVSGPRHQDTLLAASDLGHFLMERGRLGDAEPLLREAVAGGRATLPRGHRWTTRFEVGLGECLTRRGQHAEAETVLLSALENARAGEGDTKGLVQDAAKQLVALYDAWGRPAKAAPYRALAAPAKAGP